MALSINQLIQPVQKHRNEGSPEHGNSRVLAVPLLQCQFFPIPAQHALFRSKKIVSVINPVGIGKKEHFLRLLQRTQGTAEQMELEKCIRGIISRPKESNQIMDVLERGTTFLKGEGGYTGEERKVLLCAVRRSEYYQVKRLVYGIDPRAFLIVTDSAEVMGEGFRPPEER